MVVVSAALSAPVGPAGAQVLMTQKEALELAFAGPEAVERRTAYLSEEEIARIDGLAETSRRVSRAVVSYYVGRLEDGLPAAAYFDAHRVRTLQEVLMVVVDAHGRVSRIEVLGFAEPPDYLPPEGWLELFSGRALESGTSTRGDIPILTGATLTSHAVSDAVRLSLALHEVIQPFGQDAPLASSSTGGDE